MVRTGMFSARSIWWKTCFFIIYSVFLGVAVAKHEPWFDEAQAWLLARDASFLDLITKYLRYEGSPGLWHFILIVPAKLGLPYITLNIIAGIIAASASYLFLQYSPFPSVIKLLYPFSYFAFYQYAIVARSYGLVPVLMFSLAIVYKDRINKPVPFFILLILLSNVCFHGVIIALCLTLIHVFEINNKWTEIKLSLRYIHFSAVLLLGFTIFLIRMQLQIPKDLIGMANISKDISGLYNKCMPIFLNSLTVSNLPYSVKASVPEIFLDVLSKFTIVLTLFWFILRRKLLLFIIPVAAMFVFFTYVYVQPWHWGILFYTWLFVLWISYEKTDEKDDKLTGAIKPVVTVTLATVLLVQSYWTYNSFMYDYYNNYSASREVANYIKENHLEGGKIYATNFHSISILPYFPNNIFCNYNNKTKPSFWLWSSKNSMYNEPYLSLEKYNPDIIILGIKNSCSDKTDINNPYIPVIPGYKFSKFFPGALYFKNKPFETDSFILYKK